MASQMKKFLFKVMSIIMVTLFVACQKTNSNNDNSSNESVSNESASNENSLNYDSSNLALFNCTIIDGTGATPIEDGVILIAGGKIEQIGSSDSIQIPENYEKIDLAQNTVLPGFINTHVHIDFEEENLKKWLQGGVTSVRDLGGSHQPADALSLRDENNKRSDTVRCFVTNQMLTVPGGYGRSYYTSAEEAAELVIEYAEKNVDAIKFSIEDHQMNKNWEMPTKEEFVAVVDTAHANGKKAVVHLMHAKFLDLAVEIGVDQIAHMVTENIDEDTCNKIVQSDIYWIPTLELLKGISEMYHLNYEKIGIENLAMFYKAGGKIALGTDFGGYVSEFDLGFPITEVKLMKEAGMSNMDIIIAGTKNAAEVCDAGDYLGTLEKGKIADLLVVSGHPLEQIEDLQNTFMVIHNGEVVTLE